DPGRRHDDGAVDAGRVHLSQHLLGAEAVRSVWLALLTFRPGAIRPVKLPDVDLSISNEHGNPRTGSIPLLLRGAAASGDCRTPLASATRCHQRRSTTP